jgi:hypothetical protein
MNVSNTLNKLPYLKGYKPRKKVKCELSDVFTILIDNKNNVKFVTECV